MGNWFHSSVLSKRYGSPDYRDSAASFERWTAPICVAVLIAALGGVFVVMEGTIPPAAGAPE